MNEPTSCDNLNKKISTYHREYKKSKRKRRKNKGVHNSFIKKKNYKKFHKINLPESNLRSPKIHYPNKKIMSDWYWSNYKKAIEWQDKHKIAHWKACALALQEENRYLVGIIKSMNPKMVPHLSATFRNLNQEIKKRKKKNIVKNPEEPEGCSSKSCDDTEQGGDDEYEFEMSEEMMAFFEQSFKHKMDLKKLKEEKQKENEEEEIKKVQLNKVKRSEEMKLLYGEGASMIIGMETAVQLSFDKYCDMKSPKYWPNIPLKL